VGGGLNVLALAILKKIFMDGSRMVIGVPQLSYVDSLIVLGMFAVCLLLIIAYGYEYVRYKTIKPRTPRRMNKVVFGWMALMGLFIAVKASFFVGAVIGVIAFLGYRWDRYIVDRMP